MKASQIGFLLILICVLAHSVASAQRPTVDPSTRIRPQQHVRLRLSDGNRHEGRVDPTQPDSATLLLRMPTRRLPYERIDSIWVRGRAIRKSATIGGAVLGTAGLVRFWSLCFTGAGCFESGSRPSMAAKMGVVGVSTFASAGVGALLGAVVGVMVPRWKLSYARMSP
jgi:hypothetical protein